MTERTKTVARIAAAIVDTNEEPWQFYAACAGKDAATMSATRPPLVWEALAICAQCPVVAQCREWAEGETEYVGVAGGASYTSRRSSRRSTVHAIKSAS